MFVLQDAYTADQKLWLAVMQNAVTDWMYGRVRHKREAEHFLFVNKNDFGFVCQSAGLDPECVREKLRAMRAKVGLDRARIQDRVA